MEWLPLIIALGFVWHELHVLPGIREEMAKLRDENESLQSEIEELKCSLEALRDEILDVSQGLDRLKDPELCDALDRGDGYELYLIEESRKKTE